MIATAQNLENLDAHALREQVRDLMAALGQKEQTLAEHQQLLAHQEQILATRHQEILYKDTKIAQLTHEIAGLRRYRFGKSGEQLSGGQGRLLEDTVEADIAAIELELEQLRGAKPVSAPHCPNTCHVLNIATNPTVQRANVGARWRASAKT